MNILVAYDGSLNSKTALNYGIEKVKERGGQLDVLHIFDSGMFIDYDAGPKAEETARRESVRYLEEARRIMEEAEVDVKEHIFSVEGDPEGEIILYATRRHADLILCPRRYKSIMKKASCPVCLIPGNIVVPVDNTEVSESVIDRILKEARSTGSRVILAGVVPVHIYGKWEKAEIENVKKQTSSIIKKVKKLLNAGGIEAEELIRTGYPDEEIMKVADENQASMIIIPSGGDAPSELSKAVSILLDEPETLKNHVILTTPA
jgi:nucleotide-binding universal stress UspA family protein